MRRTILHISLALLTFTIGFLTSGTYDGLTIALLAALAVFILLNRIARLNITLHHLIVAALTLLIWIPFAILTLHIVIPPTSCVIDFPEEAESIKESDKQEQSTVLTEPSSDESFNVSNYYYRTNDLTSNTIWAGVVDKKAIIKPVPYYPSEVKSAGIESTVAVAVIIDTSGKVIAAQALSGNPLLRRAAIEAAYQARFHPVKICGVPPNVSGILIYSFHLH